MIDNWTAITAIGLLAVVTLVTRLSGVLIVSFVAITPRVDAFLRYAGVSVLISIIVPALVSGAPRFWLAAIGAAILMLLTRSALAAMLFGTAIAAMARMGGL